MKLLNPLDHHLVSVGDDKGTKVGHEGGGHEHVAGQIVLILIEIFELHDPSLGLGSQTIEQLGSNLELS